jgi:hypothetical protein
MRDAFEIREIDPVVVPILDEFEVSLNDWLATVRRDEPVVLPEPTANLLAAAHAESE